MESSKNKKQFYDVPYKVSWPMFQVKGIFYGSTVCIAICPTTKENFINVDIANQLQVCESSVEKNEWNEDQINELELTIGNYNFTSQFTVAAIDDTLIDIMIGSNWMDTLGTVILNTKRKFLTFFYNNEEITLRDCTNKLDSEDPPLEEKMDASEFVQDSQKTIEKLQNQQKECGKVSILEEYQDIPQLKSHIKELEDELSKLQKKYNDFEKTSRGELLEKEEEISRLRVHGQKLLSQVKKLKVEKQDKIEPRNEPENKDDKIELDSQKTNVREENQCLTNKIDELTEDVKNLREENSIHLITIKDLDNDNEVLQNEVHILRVKLEKQGNKTQEVKKQLRALESKNSDVQTNDQASRHRDVTIQCNQESQEKKDVSKNFEKILSHKDKEISRLKNHNRTLLTEIKKLKRKDISNLKMGEETITDPLVSKKSLAVESVDKRASTKGLDMTQNQSDITREVSIRKEHRESILKKQFNAISTSKKLVSSSNNMRTPLHQEEFKPDEPQHGRSNSNHYYQKVPKRIHLGWINHFSMHQFYSKLRTSYQHMSSTIL